MTLTDTQIEEFQTLYKKHFNEDIGQDAACEIGSSLVELLRIIYRPTTIPELEKVYRNEDKNENPKSEKT